jgi:hypothetical protein
MRLPDWWPVDSPPDPLSPTDFDSSGIEEVLELVGGHVDCVVPVGPHLDDGLRGSCGHCRQTLFLSIDGLCTASPPLFSLRTR